METEPVICNYCEKPAESVFGSTIYPHRKDLHGLMFWRCEPCGAYVGCHKDSDWQPLGRLANAELRAWKQKAHAIFDPFWKGEKPAFSRNDCYAWLAKKMGIPRDECHIGMFTVEECKKVIEICDSLLQSSNGPATLTVSEK